MVFQRAVLAICSVAFLLFGLVFAFFPSQITALVTGAHISPVAAADVRAIYGGMRLGIALFFYLCLRGGFEVQRIGLLAGTWTFGLIALCRVIGIAAGGISGMMIALFVSEVFGTALCAFALALASRKATAVSAA
jgi:hypothetical protein